MLGGEITLERRWKTEFQKIRDADGIVPDMREEREGKRVARSSLAHQASGQKEVLRPLHTTQVVMAR